MGGPWEGSLRPDAAAAGAVDARMVALVRCLLALSALFVFVLDAATYAQLLAYSFYSIALYLFILGGRMPVAPRAQPWIDVGVYGGLLALTGGASAMFFLYFFFPILVASFSRGWREGFAVTLVSAALAAGISLAAAPAIYLLVLGTMIAYWGGREFALRRRLSLLKDLASLDNPRLGVDHAIAQSLRRLRAFFEADACILVCALGGLKQYIMYRADATPANAAPRPLTEQSARALLALPPEQAANLLETSCFASVPYPQRNGRAGRVVLAGGKRALNDADTRFLRQAVDQMAAVIENLELIEEVMANAAQLERTRISRDIHDTTVQPYIGLKLGLEALARKLEPGSPVVGDVKELLDMSALVVRDLRGYVARLRGDEVNGWAGEHLLSGLREHVGRYRSFYGINVELRSGAAVQLSERVAAEAYQIVCEALSNIHRHTPAKRAFVDLRCEADHLAIEVGNESEPGPESPAFVPRSIAERASALGGKTEVLHNSGHDVVRVAIPL
jgi:signal transduction histidine kinase